MSSPKHSQVQHRSNPRNPVRNRHIWLTQMLEYQKYLRPSPPAASVPATAPFRPVRPTASRAARTQGNGFSALDRLSRSISSANLPSPSPASSPVPSTPTPEDQAAAAQRQLERDLPAIDVELEKYRAAGIISGAALADFDILRFWQANTHVFPLLYHVTLDIFFVQASSAPCERVFSSGKDTDTARRNSLSPRMLAVFRVLKFLFRSERLSCSNQWCDTEQEMLEKELQF
ncbi:hypothetical protein PAXRUDRAFT_829606 [Paxillus rubicundulus Ve08.2h10]|uniref:HAT C-terminal dimerisation domain-containing protein n=1 Tax=Paxillus rubicundulus Ve08.2h10 TaxID=930991 RepID=A0A0D0DZV9_9AGAM|nr:hypothetical protein PAXRUDRAFT_829606 [Paxillus rubicundulus Ve08.2h10]